MDTDEVEQNLASAWASQGQVLWHSGFPSENSLSNSMFNQEYNGIPVLGMSSDVSRGQSYIEREETWDPNSMLQFVSRVGKHLPQSRLKQVSPMKLWVDPMFRQRESIVFEVTAPKFSSPMDPRVHLLDQLRFNIQLRAEDPHYAVALSENIYNPAQQIYLAAQKLYMYESSITAPPTNVNAFVMSRFDKFFRTFMRGMEHFERNSTPSIYEQVYAPVINMYLKDSWTDQDTKQFIDALTTYVNRGNLSRVNYYLALQLIPNIGEATVYYDDVVQLAKILFQLCTSSTFNSSGPRIQGNSWMGSGQVVNKGKPEMTQQNIQIKRKIQKTADEPRVPIQNKVPSQKHKKRNIKPKEPPTPITPVSVSIPDPNEEPVVATEILIRTDAPNTNVPKKDDAALKKFEKETHTAWKAISESHALKKLEKKIHQTWKELNEAYAANRKVETHKRVNDKAFDEMLRNKKPGGGTNLEWNASETHKSWYQHSTAYAAEKLVGPKPVIPKNVPEEEFEDEDEEKGYEPPAFRISEDMLHSVKLKHIEPNSKPKAKIVDAQLEELSKRMENVRKELDDERQHYEDYMKAYEYIMLILVHEKMYEQGEASNMYEAQMQRERANKKRGAELIQAMVSWGENMQPNPEVTEFEALGFPPDLLLLTKRLLSPLSPAQRSKYLQELVDYKNAGFGWWHWFSVDQIKLMVKNWKQITVVLLRDGCKILQELKAENRQITQKVIDAAIVDAVNYRDDIFPTNVDFMRNY